MINLGELLIYICTFFGLFTATFFFITFFENKRYLKNPKLKRFPMVSVIVPAYNEEKTLAKTVESLLNLDYPRDKLEIVIIDDGSKDRTYEIAKKFIKQGIKVFTKSNSGKGDSLNFALKHVKGEFVAALDADSFVDSDCLKKMLGYFDNPKVMAVTPSLKVYKPKNFIQKIQMVEYLLGVYLRKIFSFLGSIHVTPGPFTIYRKSFFDRYGPYDANNLTEDIEIALRIQSKRYVIENTIDANVWTVSPDNMKALFKQRTRWYVGFFNNVIRYNKLFSKSFGNLGMFILPGSFISIGIAISLLLYILFRYSSELYKRILNLIAINFDIWPLLRLNLDSFYLNIDSFFLLSLISFAVGIAVIYLAIKHSEDRQPIKTAYVLYLFAYWILFAVFWIVAGITKITKRRVKWGRNYI